MSRISVIFGNYSEPPLFKDEIRMTWDCIFDGFVSIQILWFSPLSSEDHVLPVILIWRYLSENAIRPFTVGRNNWLFCDTPNEAQASAIVYTMVEMAKANGVNVYHYLTYLLEKLLDDRMSNDELELLAPWNETVKAEIERCANESTQSYVNC